MANERNCKQLAKWVIVYSDAPNDDIEVCSGHVGALLTDMVKSVYRIRTPERRADRTCRFIDQQAGPGARLA